MRIYGINVERVHGKDQPILRFADAKETKLNYVVEAGRHSFLGYRGRIDKTRQDISSTAIDAWETYINRCNRMRLQLRDRSEELAEFQRLAIDHLQQLLDDQVKIEGTE